MEDNQNKIADSKGIIGYVNRPIDINTHEGVAYMQNGIYLKIGRMIEYSQLIELCVARVLALDEIIRRVHGKGRKTITKKEVENMTISVQKWYKTITKNFLGNNEKVMENIRFITKATKDKLKEFREERNYFVHNMFKEDITEKIFRNKPYQFNPRLERLLAIGNSLLKDIQCEEKTEYKRIMDGGPLIPVEGTPINNV